MNGRRWVNTDGLTTTRKRERAVIKKNLTAVWTPEDFRAAVIELRALVAAEHNNLAPVIDITSRERIA